MDFSATNKSDNLTSVIIYEIAHVTIMADSALWFSAILARYNGGTFYIINRIIHGCIEI